jgi:aldehyde:ferredoxin oxidoreductase
MQNSFSIVTSVYMCVCLCVGCVESQQVWRCGRQTKRRHVKQEVDGYEAKGADTDGHKLKNVYDKCKATQKRLGVRDMSTGNCLAIAERKLMCATLTPEVNFNTCTHFLSIEVCAHSIAIES